jgi:hypothetical protein
LLNSRALSGHEDERLICNEVEHERKRDKHHAHRPSRPHQPSGSAAAHPGDSLRRPISARWLATRRRGRAASSLVPPRPDGLGAEVWRPLSVWKQRGVEFGEGSNEGSAESMSRLFRRPKESRHRGAVEQAIGSLEKVRRRRSAKTTSAKSEGGPYSKTVGLLGISALVALIVISLSVWLLRRRAREESTPVTPEQEEGAEAMHWEELEDEEEEWLPPGTPSAEGAPPREAPPPGEERPERRGETPTSPPTPPREEPPPGEERPGSR